MEWGGFAQRLTYCYTPFIVFTTGETTYFDVNDRSISSHSFILRSSQFTFYAMYTYHTVVYR